MVLEARGLDVTRRRSRAFEAAGDSTFGGLLGASTATKIAMSQPAPDGSEAAVNRGESSLFRNGNDWSAPTSRCD
jgi:hypothetical protein